VPRVASNDMAKSTVSAIKPKGLPINDAMATHQNLRPIRKRRLQTQLLERRECQHQNGNQHSCVLRFGASVQLTHAQTDAAPVFSSVVNIEETHAFHHRTNTLPPHARTAATLRPAVPMTERQFKR
jgi:hypothetical protein